MPTREPTRAERTAPLGPQLDLFLERALDEDRGTGDLTTDAAIAPSTRARGRLTARASGVVAGVGVFARVFELVDASVETRVVVGDGTTVSSGTVVAELAGPARALLIGERTALNLLQRLSGIASLTRRFVDRAAGRARILDTRKTTPLLRALEKYAVVCGGGENHRFGLFDEVMIKDNHVEAAGVPLASLCAALRDRYGEVRITTEARDEAEALAGIEGDADVVLLDNMSVAELTRLCAILRTASSSRSRPLEIEASGGVDLENIRAIAATGVDRVSVGALTHSAPALDLSLALEISE